MQTTTLANPFVMMTDPETILLAVERSERLNRLTRHVYRPLDRPLIPKVGAKDVSEFDSEIDAATDDSLEPEVLAALGADLA